MGQEYQTAKLRNCVTVATTGTERKMLVSQPLIPFMWNIQKVKKACLFLDTSDR